MITKIISYTKRAHEKICEVSKFLCTIEFSLVFLSFVSIVFLIFLKKMIFFATKIYQYFAPICF